MSFSRFARCVVPVLLLGIPPTAGQSAGTLYAPQARLPRTVNGQPLQTFAFDPVTTRLYAGSREGLFRADLDQQRFVGPLIRARISKLAFAPDLGRLFYLTDEDVWYLDVRDSFEPVRVGRIRAWDLAYEPDRQELYVSHRGASVFVFDARSGEKGRTIPLPGWHARDLEGAPGRVYLQVSPRDGLYVVDAATHRVAPWPVSGRIRTPAYMDADPAGRHLFLTHDREIVAIDVETAAVVGRRLLPHPPAIAFDPGTGWLVASWLDEEERVRIGVFGDGLTSMVELPGVADGQVGLEPTHRGFLQRGYSSLLVWSFREPAR